MGISSKIYWVYLTGFFLIILQLINVLPPWFTPTDWGKAIMFKIIMAVLISIFLLQITFKKISINTIKEKIKSVFFPFLALSSLFGIYLLATVFSLDAHFSLWGNPQRNGGFINFTFYILFSFLLFLIVKKKDWQKIFDLSMLVGIAVSLVAIIQQLGLFSYFLVSFEFRPVSTMGNTILLSIYLLLLTFVALSLGLKEKNLYKKIFYFFSLSLFILVIIFSTETRGTIIGLVAGFAWFFFAYPTLKKRTKVLGIASLLILLCLMLTSKIYLDRHLDAYRKLPPVISNTIDRTLSIFEGSKIMGSRISAWTVSLKALKERPLLGFGPENFMIAFDKYYDPTLAQIGPDESGVTQAEWWDRAHSILFDVSLTTGIPSLIIYILLFAVLIWELQKSKKKNIDAALMSHGLQAAFIGYFISLLFSFDSVSTYLVFFLLIGYSLHLISDYSEKEESFPKFQNAIYSYRIFIASIILIFLLLFVFVYNIKPLILNKEINMAEIYSNNEMCPNALEIINRISPQIKGSITDDYLSRKLITVIYGCIRNVQNKDQALIGQAIETLKVTTNSHPAYLQNWILLGEFDNILIEEKNKLTGATFVSNEEMDKLKAEANLYFKKANELSPKRQIVLKEWVKTKIITNEYKEAEEKINECLALNPNYLSCVWEMALVKGYSKDLKGFAYYSNLAKEKRYDTESEESLRQVIDMFIKNSDYGSLVAPYQKLIEITKDGQQKAQLHAALAATYFELKQYQNAKKEAQKIFDLVPYFPSVDQAQVRSETESFIKNLGQ